jgi:hypothetical protein
MLYVHPKKIDLSVIGEDSIAIQEIVKNYNPLKEDKAFLHNLYERKKYDS